MIDDLAGMEAAYVGGVILAPAETDRLGRPVGPEHLADTRLGTILAATLRVYHSSPALAGDPTAVVLQLRNDGDLDRVGGASTVADLVSQGCVRASIGWYGERILHAAQLRRLAAGSARIQQVVATNPVPTSAEEADAISRFAWE